MPCYLCNAIEQNVRGAKAGNHLVRIGPAVVTQESGKDSILVSQHKCSECGAKWKHVDDPGDPNAGWVFIPPA